MERLNVGKLILAPKTFQRFNANKCFYKRVKKFKGWKVDFGAKNISTLQHHNLSTPANTLFKGLKVGKIKYWKVDLGSQNISTFITFQRLNASKHFVKGVVESSKA